jgi:hypothetical protein
LRRPWGMIGDNNSGFVMVSTYILCFSTISENLVYTEPASSLVFARRPPAQMRDWFERESSSKVGCLCGKLKCELGARS